MILSSYLILNIKYINHCSECECEWVEARCPCSWSNNC